MRHKNASRFNNHAELDRHKFLQNLINSYQEITIKRGASPHIQLAIEVLSHKRE